MQAYNQVEPSVPQFDRHEPVLMKSLLGPMGWREADLNGKSWADYRWPCGNSFHHVERKTWGELGDLDSVEEQLRRHLTNHESCGAKLTWVLEGLVTPTLNGYVVYKEASSKGRILFVGNHQAHRPLKMVHAWLYRISDFVEVLQTSCVVATANLLAAMYESDQKPEHSTFARYYKAVTWNPNPQVAKLISVGDGIGPTKAQAIIERFGTVYGVLTADPKVLASVPGIGLGTATKLLQRLGRPDV